MGAFVSTISKIEEVGLDRLVFAHVKGFKSLVPRGSHYEGEPVVFIEPDSVLPDEPWTETYKKYAPKRVKPIKLAGFLTEGIVLGFNDIPSDSLITAIQEGIIEDDRDVSLQLGITKYESPPLNEESAIGRLPEWLPKTDEVRWEHLPLDAIVGKSRHVTLKIDGTSCTFVIDRECNIRVFGRTLEHENDGSSKYSRVLQTQLGCGVSLEREIQDAAWQHFVEDETVEAVVFRGELFGENIQKRGKNPHATRPLGWKCFGSYELRRGELDYRLTATHFPSEFCADSGAVVEGEYLDVDEEFIAGVQEGAGLPFAPEFYEGVVIHFPPYEYKRHTYTSCKVINKAYDALV